MPKDPSVLIVIGLGALCFFLFWQRKSKQSSQARASLKSLLDDDLEFKPAGDDQTSRPASGKKPLDNPFELSRQEDDD